MWPVSLQSNNIHLSRIPTLESCSKLWNEDICFVMYLVRTEILRTLWIHFKNSNRTGLLHISYMYHHIVLDVLSQQDARRIILLLRDIQKSYDHLDK